MLDAADFVQAGTADPAQVLQDLANEDPRMAMMMKLMQARHAPPAAEDMPDDRPDDRDELIAELSERLDAAEARLAKMTRVARQLHAANATATDRLGQLAAALGACGLCWGEDERCPGCRGRGGVGMIRPDPAARADLLARRAATMRQHAGANH